MASLTQPTGSILCPTFAGELSTLGTLTATKIDAIISNEPTTNPVTRAFTHIVELVGTDLDATEYPIAYTAMIAACKYELLEWDRQNQEGIPNAQGGGILIDAYNDKMTRYANTVGIELRKLGILQSNYYVFFEASVERIGGAVEILENQENHDYYGTTC